MAAIPKVSIIIPVYNGEKFVKQAIEAKRPVDLGSRCTVFMNSKINKKEYITNKCAEIFSLDKKNKPRWIQEPEWPVVNGSPLKFVKQIREYDKVKFYFINNNDEYVVVEQFY